MNPALWRRAPIASSNPDAASHTPPTAASCGLSPTSDTRNPLIFLGFS